MGTCVRPCHCNYLQSLGATAGTAALIWGRKLWISGRPSLQLCKRRPQPRTQCLLFVSSVAETLEPAKTAADLALELLEWPKVLEIVSSFAGTPSAKELVQGFSIPCTQVECEDLLSQTSTAMDLLAHLGSTLDFGGIPTNTVESCLSRLQKGFVITGTEAVAIALLLQFTNTIRHDIKVGADKIIQPNNALSSFIDTIYTLGIQADLLKIIWKAVNEDGSVKDSASSELQKARIQQRVLEEKVQALLSSMLRGQGSNASTHEVEGRFCIAVSGDYEKNPPGLLLRSGGSTSYIEPVSIVPLNDKLAEARASVSKAEYEALRSLTNKVLPQADNISILLDRIIHLDMIVARAKFSLMYQGSKPIFTVPQGAVGSSAEVEREGICTLLPEMNPGRGVLLQLRQAYHPLLLHQYWQYTRDQKRISFGKKKKVGTTKSLQLVPIDVNVPEHVKVITITGPNTGGKTAAMKTVGLAALMAKSGLYVLAADPVYLPWFDAVFADIGDEQSLSQSLSTFSGHLRRINHIKESCTGESLVLLDELKPWSSHIMDNNTC